MRELFNADWKFLLGDPEGAYREDYPDRTWRRVDLPHDWVIEQPFDRDGDGSGGYTGQNMQGFFAWKGVAWYRKRFVLEPETLAGPDSAPNGGPNGAVYLYFGGIYRNSRVFVNGREAGGRAYGYSSFELDITGLARPGENTVAVRLDNGCEAPDRWYSGSGIYRNVYLRIVPALHIKTWGVHIMPALADVQDEDHAEKAEVTVDVTVVNRVGKTGAQMGAQMGEGWVCLEITGPTGDRAAAASRPFQVPANGEVTVRQRVVIRNPLLWSAEQPRLYRAFVHINQSRPIDHSGRSWIRPPEESGGEGDKAAVGTTGDGVAGGAVGGATDGTSNGGVEVPFGIRSIELVSRRGMRVNGEPVKLKGVCLHHDCGILGAAYHDEAWRRRLLTLKDLGCNAVRTSHNPPAEEFLDLCDELGFYVIDECFDKWRSGYYAAHFDDDWRRDLEAWVLRDRNHPSVFLWSVGNEVEEQGAGTMPETLQTLVSAVRALDDRPVTCALHPHVIPRSLVGAPVSRLVELTQTLTEAVDVLGLNYHEPLYGAYTAAIDKPIVGTESYEYYSSTAENYEDVTGKNPWRYALENDNVLGQFIWAGIDYLGESLWPAKGWAGAMLDICGFLKPNAFYRKSIWSSEPVVYLGISDEGRPDYVRGRWSFPHTAPHLNLDHLNRRTVKAAVYTNCDYVELRINGVKRGTRRPGDFENGIIEWVFDYEEGELEAVGYRGGAAVCRHLLKTAGPARRIELVPDRTSLPASGIVHITVSVTDEAGTLCPTDCRLVAFALSGDGEILGASSPDLNTPLGFRLPKTYVSGGKALVIVRAGASPGPLCLTAYADGIESARREIQVV
jgi:beta-galactosidase